MKHWQAALAAMMGAALSFGLVTMARATPNDDTAQQGAANVGLFSLQVVDAQRVDQLHARTARSWRLDLYYPAQAGGTPLAYARDRLLLEQMQKDGYYDVPEQELALWQHRRAPAKAGAPPLTSTAMPLILLLPGMGVAGMNYAELCSRLASRGFVVAFVDAPYIGLARGTDGTIRSSVDDPLLRESEQDRWGPRIDDWVQDVRVSLNHIATSASLHQLGLNVDTRAVVVAGHSLGGAVALDSCAADARIAACADFEGAPFGTRIEKEGPKKPTLFVLSRSKRTGQQVVPPDAKSPMFSFLHREGGPPAWAVSIQGGSHMSFSDAPVMMPKSLSRFGGDLMSADRSFEVYSSLLTAFAKDYRTSANDAAFASSLSGIPEALGVDLNR